ncbi:hypothetical protein SLE2022_067050 [Rubroshorea leprosula]
MARRQANAGPSSIPDYEDFLPQSEMKEEQEAHLLYIHIPDFSKEQVRVIYYDATRTVRVQGERPLETNKWSRFNRTFDVPLSCSVEKIRAKFHEGILTIIIPKQIIKPPQPAAGREQEGTKITPEEKEPSSVTAPPPKKETTQMAGKKSSAGPSTSYYEDFLPKAEMKEEQEAHLLYVHLPDFSKEQVRVIYYDATRTVRVQGERPLETNKWSRFNQAFDVPLNCSVEKMHGKFREGILTIIIPKQIIKPPQPAVGRKLEGTKITPKAAAPPSKPAAFAQLLQGETTGKDQETSPAFQTPQKPKIEPKGQEQGDTSTTAEAEH